MVESEWVMPPMPVSEVAGAMADVSAPDVVPFFSQPARARTAASTRIVFIVTPSGVGGTFRLTASSERPLYISEGEGILGSGFVKMRKVAEPLSHCSQRS